MNPPTQHGRKLPTTWYSRIQSPIKTTLAFLAPTQATNLALLVSALLRHQMLRLSELARAYPRPPVRRVAVPKHDLLYRLKRLWRFLNNERVDPLVVQGALIPSTIAHLGSPRWLGLAIDWTMFDAKLPTGARIRYHRYLARSLRHQTPDEPWYLATSLAMLQQAVAWYQRRWWIEASFSQLQGEQKAAFGSNMSKGA